MSTYASDLTDKEWLIIDPLLGKHYPPYSIDRPNGGCIMSTDMRKILDGIFYVIKTGCQWSYIPKDYPPKGTVYYHFAKMRELGVWDKILEITNRSVRKAEDRTTDPTFGLIDSQSAKTIYDGDNRGIDGNKKVKGRKRHIIVDILGCLLAIIVHAANISDTIAAEEVMIKSVATYPSIKAFCGDEGYRGTAVEAASQLGRPMEISKKIVGENEDPKKWKVIPKRWIVERTFAWMQNSRRLSKDYERKTKNSESVFKIAAIRLNLRKLSKC
jgi:putative transposase